MAAQLVAEAHDRRHRSRSRRARPARRGPLPTVRLRPFAAADARLLRRWEGVPERFLRMEDLLESAEAEGTVTSVATDVGGDVVAVVQAGPEGSLRPGVRSVVLLVHPGHRGAGVGRAALLAALAEPDYAGSALLAVVDRENVASLRCFTACGFVANPDASSERYVHLVLAHKPHPTCGAVRMPDGADRGRLGPWVLRLPPMVLRLSSSRACAGPSATSSPSTG